MSLHDKLIREREQQSTPIAPMFTVCNLEPSGARSVGSRAMTREETIAFVAARTGLTRWTIAARLDKLDSGSIDLAKNPCNFEGSTDVRITREETS